DRFDGRVGGGAPSGGRQKHADGDEPGVDLRGAEHDAPRGSRRSRRRMRKDPRIGVPAPPETYENPVGRPFATSAWIRQRGHGGSARTPFAAQRLALPTL